ncbi:MAG: hypothetical protein EOP10_09190 [Proteobacteria bacterium]|nr:MAG: hypothetical protein EOP10_09190 [Pseudomonadota bacterium]
MKTMATAILLALYLGYALPLAAHDHGEEATESGANVGPDKAVLILNETGFQLRDGVEERFGVKTAIVTSKDVLLPKESIVYSKEEYQVLRRRSNLWKSIDVDVKRKGQFVLIQSADLKSGDAVATQGAGLLKVIEISISGPEPEGHIH